MNENESDPAQLVDSLQIVEHVVAVKIIARPFIPPGSQKKLGGTIITILN
jgi:regulator of RNase E activity RraA